jgi:hypothetical protein
VFRGIPWEMCICPGPESLAEPRDDRMYEGTVGMLSEQFIETVDVEWGVDREKVGKGGKGCIDKWIFQLRLRWSWEWFCRFGPFCNCLGRALIGAPKVVSEVLWLEPLFIVSVRSGNLVVRDHLSRMLCRSVDTCRGCRCIRMVY